MKKNNMKTAKAIRREFAEGAGQLELAAKYDCDRSTIYSIVHNRSFYDEKYKAPAPRKPFNINLARKLRNKGATLVAIAEQEAKASRRKRPFSLSHICRLLKWGNK